MQTKKLNQEQRINGAFLFLSGELEKGNVDKAFTFFSNVVKTGSQLAREDERVVFAKSTIVLDNFEASSE